MLFLFGGCFPIVPGWNPSTDPCVTWSSCSSCVDDSSNGCRWCPSDGTCSADGDGSSCGFSDSVSFCSGGTGGGGTGGGGVPGTGGGSSGVGGGGGTTTSSGACAYFHTSLNRILCEQRSSASSCTGKYFGAGTTCAGLQCGPIGDNDPQHCTLGGGGTGGGGGSSTGTGGGGGTNVFCGRYRIEDPGSSSTPGTGTVLDMNTGMRWTRFAYTPKKTQADSISHCSSRGWRLPTRSEAQAIAGDCCATINGVHSCSWTFRGFETWTTTGAGTGQAYYVISNGITCLPSNCVNSTTTTHAIMCIK